jgi:TolA-binding protein
LLLAVALIGCAHAKAPAPRVLNMQGTIITPTETLDDSELFERARHEAAAKHFELAVERYDLLLRNFPDSDFVLPSLYNVGLVLEDLHRYADASERYRELVRRFPVTRDAADALYRMGACEAEITQWVASKAAFAELVARSDLSLADRIEAIVRRGYAEFNLRQLDVAEQSFRDALDLYRQHETEERLDSPFFLAMAQYHLGAISQERYALVAIHLPEQRMAADMEQKAGLLLDAQTKYVKAIRLRDPHWAAAAGYQIGVLYRSFYDALVAAPVPEPIAHDAEARAVYMEELKAKIRPLLEKAIRTHEQTLLLGERAAIDDDWVRRSREELDALRRLLGPAAAPEERDPLPPKPPTTIPGRPTDAVHGGAG